MALSNPERAQVGRIRRRLHKDGQDLRKVREDSPWYVQYGPFMVVDISTTAVVASGISDLDELERELSATG